MPQLDRFYQTPRFTRFDGLKYVKHAPQLWRIIDATTGKAVGPQYRTKDELLADLPRFALVFGSSVQEPPQ